MNDNYFSNVTRGNPISLRKDPGCMLLPLANLSEGMGKGRIDQLLCQRVENTCEDLSEVCQ